MMSPTRRQRRVRHRDTSAPPLAPSGETTDEAFSALRSGAINIAGVTFQVATSALLLAAGRLEGGELPTLTAIRPEGFEDVDCKLLDGTWMLVQCKQRSEGRPAIARRELAQMLVHSARAMRTRDYDGSISRLAVVTDGRFSDELGPSGWDTSLKEWCSDEGLDLLSRAIEDILGSSADGPDATEILAMTHTVVLDHGVLSSIEATLSEAYGTHPSVAALVRAELFADIALLSATQRGSSPTTALKRTVQDLDSRVETLERLVDTSVLDAAMRSGVCEFANFAAGSADSAAQFYAGVRVNPGHVAAGLDVARKEELEHVGEALQISRNVVVTGPSGAGKSALMWRAAASRTQGELTIRVLRLATEEDANGLVAHVWQLRPSAQRPVLVCVDDLGRDQTAFWPRARDRLLEIPNVVLLGACRGEDLTPGVSLGAALVSAELTPSSARLIYERIRAIGQPMAVEIEEAVDRSGGLLMEFIAVATTGKRIRDVLAEQVESLTSSGGSVAVAALRTVLALHTLGHAVPAQNLSSALDANDDEISRALSRLREEHLVMRQGEDTWLAIHDLRAEVLLDLLHSAPPPSMAATYARCIAAMRYEHRAALYRRALTRLVRRLTGTGSVASISQSLEPLATAIANDFREAVAAGRPGDATRFAELGEKVDVCAYVGATQRDVQRIAPATGDPDTMYLVAYASRFTNLIDHDGPLARLSAYSRVLPEWHGAARSAVVGAIDSGRLKDLLCEAPTEVAVHLSESLEGACRLSVEEARQVYRAHQGAIVAEPLLLNRGLLAQLTASLFVLAGAQPADAELMFGDIAARAEWAVAADDMAYEVSARLDVPTTEMPATTSRLAGAVTFGEEEFAEVRVAAFARTSHDSPAVHAYEARKGEDPTSVNAQACFFAQRIFDACPEADLVRTRITSAAAGVRSDEPLLDGVKNLRRGVLVRRASQRRTSAIQAVLVELRSSELWSERCRRQTTIAEEILQSLRAVPARLNPWDNAGRKSAWLEKLSRLQSDVGALPGFPLEPMFPTIEDESTALGVSLDRLQRERGTDLSQRALGQIVEALVQFGRSASSDAQSLTGAAMRLSEASKAVTLAREHDPLPAYADLGETLPTSLEDHLQMAARFISAAARDILPRRALDTEELVATIDSHSRSTAEIEVERLTNCCVEADVTIIATAISEDPEPVVPSNPHVVIAAVDSMDWARLPTVFALMSPTEVSHPELVVPVSNGKVLGFGVRALFPNRTPFPLATEKVSFAAAALGLEVAAAKWSSRAATILAGVIAEHARQVRQIRRPAHWPRAEEPAPASWPALIEMTGPPEWISAVDNLRELSALAQDGGSIDGLVAAFGAGAAFPSVDFDDRAQYLTTTAMAHALVADLTDVASETSE